MEEFNAILHTDGTPAAEPPREVVLRYEAPRPRPVVERYVHAKPLPGARQAAPEAEDTAPAVPDAARYVFTPPAKRPKRSRKGFWIFLACLAVVLIAAIILGIVYLRRSREHSDNVYRYEYEWHGSYDEYSGSETSIERYPNGDGTRLRYAETHGSELRIQDIYARVNPCTVTVATALPNGSAVIGTGVIFTPDGYILTNAHVITGGKECYVVLDSGKSYTDVKLVGYDVEQDLAVIKISAHLLPTAEFGDSDALTVGDTVYAIGNPLGVELRGTLTDGIVSAINRDVLVDGVNMTLIQTNAALNNGNSGGPLINVYGQVVGINTMKMGSSSAVSVEGLGFAIPISSAAWMVDDLIEYGEIHGEPVLGIMVEPVELPTGESAIAIREVSKGTASEKAGLQADDYIVRADGDPLENVNDLLRARRRYRAGETLPLEIERDGERFMVDVTLEESTE